MKKAIVILVIGGILLGAVIAFQRLNVFERFNLFSAGCETAREKKIVRGNSLEPLIKDSQKITVLVGYYQCNQIKRGDVVTFNYAGSEEPLIKIVKGVPDDFLSLEQSSGGWNILVQGEILKNSEGTPYLLQERGYRMLSLYVNDYKGVIPENAFLLLGNIPNGSVDSAFFGLVDKKEITGKVVF